MTQITAKIVADSISEAGKRITTMELRYPRIIHGEFMTHRMFSRNARSSRAVPVKKMIDEVRDHPYIPIHFGKNQPGMQARAELTGNDLEQAKRHWRIAVADAVSAAGFLNDCGAHKQIVNRVLEPFSHIDVLVTSTEWDNFYALRDHDDAQPEIRALAKAMRAAHDASIPNLLKVGEWHQPYITPEDIQSAFDWCNGGEHFNKMVLNALSVARCARISYAPFDGNPSVSKEMERFKSLAESGHWSPFEHQATPDDQLMSDGIPIRWNYTEDHGNFIGWRQYRRVYQNDPDNQN